jgi:glycine cleavage system transcriptional repressor
VVAALSEVLLADGGNLEDASMTVLSGAQFAMSLVVDVPHEAAQVQEVLAPVAARLDLLVAVRPVSVTGRTEPSSGAPEAAPYLLRLHGADRPGLVHRATALLAAHEANITGLTTRVAGAVGAAVYVMIVGLDLPAGADVEAMQTAVRALAADLDVEIALSPADDDLL